MNPLCIRCGRRERAPGLFVCADCAERLVAPKRPVQIAEWVRRAERSELPALVVGGVAA